MLAEFFIKVLSNENDLIYVPFVGSGTEIVAASKLNRQYLGTEINPKYFEMAKRRLAI